MSDYDLIVIGGGPGGYVAAERAGHAGLKTLLIEKSHLGGVCLNCGCVPSKTLLNSAKIYHYAVDSEAFGVTAESVTFNFGTVMERKQKVIETLRKGIAGMMKRNKVTVVNGVAEITGRGTVSVDGASYTAENILVSTGSAPAMPPLPGIDRDCVYDSTGILELDALPESLVIVGGGVIGCEFACFFASVGVPVTIVEMLPEIVPPVDGEIGKMLRQALTKLGAKVHVGARVSEIGDGAVTFTDAKGKTVNVDASHVLVATGRRCNVEGLGLEAAGVDFDRRGIRIDERCATNVPGIWAAGDCTGRQWLAHSASRMGEVVVHNITGRSDRMRYNAVPGVVYTNPEVATVGLTEAEAEAQGIPVEVAKVPMGASGRFLAENEGTRGLVKVLVHKQTRQLLGVHMIGGACSEMIFGAAAMIETEMRVQEIEEVVFPHPTVGELIKDLMAGL